MLQETPTNVLIDIHRVSNDCKLMVNEDEELSDDKLRRRVEEFIDKVNRGFGRRCKQHGVVAVGVKESFLQHFVFLLISSSKVMLDVHDSVEEIGEKSVRKICCGCDGSTSLMECFLFAGSPARSKPLLPDKEKTHKK
ncbi:hypothetical protein QVD17_41516 [Tagetes erecta]|uniref:Uncharacterized protein n=1 Tax=Tagetes erecta TaxID=13708 RepID=A0AAD8JPF0_TARER|nr:hypothetical protein QVD17_41516 [Tagetes erecta]